MVGKKKDEKKHDPSESEYTFIQETIRTKKHAKLKRTLFTFFLACLFGFVSCLVFCFCLPYVTSALKVDRRVITFAGVEESEQPQASKAPIANVTTVVPSVTATPTVTPKPTTSAAPQIKTSDLTSYLSMHRELKELAKEVNRSVVTITSVKNGTDVFNNPSENTNSTCGIVIGNNGKELLVFVNGERIESANYLKVKFQDGTTVDASLYSMYEELGIAIIAVNLVDLSKEVLEAVECIEFGDSRALVTGDPVIALGNPNGYMYSVEYGFVSNSIYHSYITDTKVELINTTIPYNENGEGIIVNLQGQLLGFITNQTYFKNDLNKEINTCIGITRLKPIIEKLVNHKELIYFGIVGNDVTTEIAQKIGIESGVYVMEVQVESPAFDGALKKGDVITKIDDSEITNMNQFYNIITSYKSEETIDVTFIRKITGVAEEMTCKVTLSTLE